MPILTRRPVVPPAETPFNRSARLLEEKRETLAVEKHNLDEEWVAHPGLVSDVGDEHALAISYRDEAKDNMELSTAQADADIRRLNAAKGDKAEKLTEGQIRAMQALDKKVVGATQNYRAWKLLADQWAVLVKSFDSRQYALRHLTGLWEKGYFASTMGGVERGAAQDRVATTIRRQGTS